MLNFFENPMQAAFLLVAVSAFLLSIPTLAMFGDMPTDFKLYRRKVSRLALYAKVGGSFGIVLYIVGNLIAIWAVTNS